MTQAPSPLKFLDTLKLTLMSLVLAVVLAELYAATAALLADPAPAWVAAALVNTLLAVVIVLVLWRRQQGESQGNFFLQQPPLPPPSGRFFQNPRWAFAPAVVVLFGSITLTGMSRLGGSAPALTQLDIAWSQIAWLTWVPVIEELVFRVGLSQVFRRQGGWLAGAWFSSLTFALVHASPTLANLRIAQIGLPLGPFFLGLACETLLARTGRLAPIVLLHAACNTTAIIFALGDARWLRWLSFLYL